MKVKKYCDIIHTAFKIYQTNFCRNGYGSLLLCKQMTFNMVNHQTLFSLCNFHQKKQSNEKNNQFQANIFLFYCICPFNLFCSRNIFGQSFVHYFFCNTNFIFACNFTKKKNNEKLSCCLPLCCNRFLCVFH